MGVNDELKSFASNFAVWSVLAFIFMELPLALLFGSGAAVASATRYVERRKDLLVRGLGFLIMSISVILLRSDSWWRVFISASLGWISMIYAAAYALWVIYGSDFLERNFLGVAIVGIISAFIFAYPSSTSAVRTLFYLLTVMSILYLTYLVSTYVSSLRRESADIEPLPLPELTPRGDAYSKDIERIVKAFVEKGDKVPLLVFLIRNSPRGLYDLHLEEIIRPLVDYSEVPVSPLAPPWLVEKKAEEEKIRRALLIRELTKRLSTHVGVRGWTD
ncbi:hypothetical protein [Thermococcus sp. ES12]|uniref:hypothetical protein n=1 Tax=Thermococcus sp. ES12 TaxID=1638246 RepID=UPI0014313FC4|nr:hypothetical protein [Thermococcus sp. ES12]NJE77359.1 hypothetical protein [Thermococcus sp. ES12]